MPPKEFLKSLSLVQSSLPQVGPSSSRTLSLVLALFAVELTACSPDPDKTDTIIQDCPPVEEARDDDTAELDSGIEDTEGLDDTGAPEEPEPELRPYNLDEWGVEGVGANIASELMAEDASFDPSGIEADVDNLYLVSNVGGRFAQLSYDGVVRMNMTIEGDLEGLAKDPTRSGIFWVVREDTKTIVEFDINTGGYTGVDCTPNIETTQPNWGIEGLTVVPFGHQPSSWPEDELGYLVVGTQLNGSIAGYKLSDCADGAEIAAIANIASPVDDNAGLFYSSETGILYALYDSHATLVEFTLDGEEIKRHTLPTGSGALIDEEGIVLTQYSCDTETHQGTADAWFALDDGGMRKISGLPITCQDPRLYSTE